MRIGLTFLVLATALSCTSKTTDSTVKLDNGFIVKASDADPLRAIVEINVTQPHPSIPGANMVGSCTATAVSDTTLIFAAHCLAAGNRYPICVRETKTSNMAAGKCSSKTFGADPKAVGAHTLEDSEKDLAIAIFEANTFDHYFSVTDIPGEVGNLVYLVGLSDLINGDQNRPASDGVFGHKRWGANTLRHSDTPENRGYTIVGGSLYTTASLSAGDSGGPMINKNCQIIGTASAGSNEPGRQPISYHSKIASNIEWLRSYEKQGAYFCGLSGDKCDASKTAAPIASGQKTADGREIFPCGSNGGSGEAGGSVGDPTPTPKPSPSANAPAGDFLVRLNSATGSNSRPELHISAPTSLKSVTVCFNVEAASCTSSEGKTIGTIAKTAQNRNFFNAGETDDLSTITKIVIVGDNGSLREFGIKPKG